MAEISAMSNKCSDIEITDITDITYSKMTDGRRRPVSYNLNLDWLKIDYCSSCYGPLTLLALSIFQG